MGIRSWLRRSRARRRELERADSEAALQLAQTTLAEAAPAVAEALQALHGVVTARAFDAVQSAYDALAPDCRQAVADAREHATKHYEQHCERVQQLAARCGDAVQKTRECQSAQAEELRGMRELYAEQQAQTRRWQEGYDWQLIKEFAFRFIRILDGLAEQVETLDAGSHRDDLADVLREIEFALEASGIEQFRPAAGSAFAGQEKRLKVVARREAPAAEQAGCIAATRAPGYVLARPDQPDRILRPASVEVFGAAAAPDSTEHSTQQPQEVLP